MNDPVKYVRPEDIQEYQRFCTHFIPHFGRELPAELWHYTDAQGLIGILRTGSLWATQVACLNDNLEQLYFGHLVHQAVKKRRATNADEKLAILLRVADEALASADFSAFSHFVCCFSEVEDDLGQWRGYGGGECGYAIGFRTEGLLTAVGKRQPSFIVPMSYDPLRHDVLVSEVVRNAEIYFFHGLSRGITDIETWAVQFVAAFAAQLEIFSSILKHPKFSSEVERRIATFLLPGEHSSLIFRQKRTLLARHLPINLTSIVANKKLLPISRIFVGPGPAQKVSKISVGDLLVQTGYDNVLVELSVVPYRVP